MAYNAASHQVVIKTPNLSTWCSTHHSSNLSPYSGGNRWPAGGYWAGCSDSSSRAVSRRCLPLPGGGAWLPLDRRHCSSRRLELLCQPPLRFLVQLVLSESGTQALVRGRDGADSPGKSRPALQGPGIPPPAQPPSSWWHDGGAKQGERERRKAQARGRTRRRRSRGRKSSREEEQEQASAEGAKKRLNVSRSRREDFQWRAHIYVTYTWIHTHT